MSILEAAAEHLGIHYGKGEAFDLGSAWSTAAALLLHHGRRTHPRVSDWTWLPDTVLASSSETASSTPAVLGRLLESHGHSPQKGKPLHRLASWWSDADTLPLNLDPEAKAGFRQATGLSLELTDALLLFAGGQLVFPLSRGTQRIVCRHGWLDPQTSYEDWQAWLCRTAPAPANLAQLWEWFGRTAHDFCGPAPKCENCPLRPLLPPNGPRPLDADSA